MNPAARTPRSPLLPGLALAGLILASAGCVRRVVEITSEPSGALVWMNDREVGTTPCEVEILHYGTFDLRVASPGYEPVMTGRKASAPVWDLPGPDLVAELLPFEVESRTNWHVTLEPEDLDPDAVLERAEAARDRLLAMSAADPVPARPETAEGLAEAVEAEDGDGRGPAPAGGRPGGPVEGPIGPVSEDPVAEPPIPGLLPGEDPEADPGPPPAVVEPS